MIKPTANRLVVKVIAEDAPKEGEKINGNKVMTANVLRVGPDVKAIVPGDIVMFSPFGFDERGLGWRMGFEPTTTGITSDSPRNQVLINQ